MIESLENLERAFKESSKYNEDLSNPKKYPNIQFKTLEKAEDHVEHYGLEEFETDIIIPDKEVKTKATFTEMIKADLESSADRVCLRPNHKGNQGISYCADEI